MTSNYLLVYLSSISPYCHVTARMLFASDDVLTTIADNICWRSQESQTAPGRKFRNENGVYLDSQLILSLLI